MNVCEHLTESARLFPDKVALVFETEHYTYARLDRLSIAAARRLVEAGVAEDDRVALQLANVPAFVAWYYAALRIGAIAVSISTRLSDEEVEHAVSDYAAKAFVGSRPAKKTPARKLPECVETAFEVSDAGDPCGGPPLIPEPQLSTWFAADPHASALILYTSGTTGFAKGATLSQMNVRSNVSAFNHLCQMQPTDRILLAVPLFHCFGQNALLNSALNAGATIILQRGFDLNEAKRLVTEQRVTQLYGVPTMFQLLHDLCSPEDLASVRYCFSAAAPLPVQVSRRWHEKFGLPIHEGYGLTETSPFASYNHRLKYVMGSIGTPIDAVEMQIVDTETKQPCEVGDLGEIAIRGPNVMLGYWNRPEETARVMRDGWFFSGDIGRVDQQGYFYIVDRVKDMISVGGLKVYPAEVERVLLDHAAISQVAVVGLPDKVLGERVVAFVVPGDGVVVSPSLADDLTRHAQEHFAHYKIPQQVEFIDELPRNPSGKVLKTHLRKYELPSRHLEPSRGGEAAADEEPGIGPDTSSRRAKNLRSLLAEAHPASRPRLAVQFLQDTVQQLTGSPELPDRKAGFLDAGLDSIMIVEMSRRVQEELGGEEELPPTLIFDHPRICDLANWLVSTVRSDQAPVTVSRPTATTPASPSVEELGLHGEVSSMSEDEALEELLRELRED